VLIRDDLRAVVTAIDLSRYTMRTIKQKPLLGFLLQQYRDPRRGRRALPFGFLLNPMIAGAAMAFSSVSVVGNSLLMRRYQSPK